MGILPGVCPCGLPGVAGNGVNVDGNRGKRDSERLGKRRSFRSLLRTSEYHDVCRLLAVAKLKKNMRTSGNVFK